MSDIRLAHGESISSLLVRHQKRRPPGHHDRPERNSAGP